MLKKLLSDENWDFNYNLISVYSHIDKSALEEEKFELEEESKLSIEENQIVKKVQFANIKTKPQNVLQGFAYLLTDIFANTEDFDMRKVQKKEKAKQEEEIKAALMKAKASSPARKLKRHQSPARIRELQKKKARRGKEREERRQKLLETRSYPVYKLIRIKSGITNVPSILVDAPFLSSEIDEARLRILNREYFINKELEELERLLDEEDIELFDPKDSNEVDVGKVIKEDKLEGLVHPKQRCQGGVWFVAEDFPIVLSKYIIYHDILHFPYKVLLDDT
jgi:hypothetical protein